MHRKIAAIVLFLAGLVATPSVYAECIVNTATPTYINGKRIDLQCDENGNVKTTATLSGGGDASAANQVTLNGYVDGLETLITSTNTKLDTVISSVNTELPAAAALADATANPTVPGVASFNMCFNGTTWDRCVKSSAGAGAVDTGTARVTTASDDPINVGTSNNHHLSVGTTEDETEIKATAGVLKSIQVSNVAATVAYLRCANLTAANTTPGTSTIFWGMAVPGATTGAGLTAQIGGVNGLAFSTALTCWVVTGKAATDVAEVGANDVEWNIQYK